MVLQEIDGHMTQKKLLYLFLKLNQKKPLQFMVGFARETVVLLLVKDMEFNLESPVVQYMIFKHL